MLLQQHQHLLHFQVRCLEHLHKHLHTFGMLRTLLQWHNQQLRSNHLGPRLCCLADMPWVGQLWVGICELHGFGGC
jgi:hypothetical protein